MMILVNCGCCGVASGYGCAMWCTHGANGVQGTVLYEGSDVRTVNGFVLPRDRGLEYASLKYRRRNSVIIIASLREYKRCYAPTNSNMEPPTFRETISDQCDVLIIFDLAFDRFT